MKYGFLALTDITEDIDLPFHPKNLEMHVRKVFLHGNNNFLPFGYDELKNKNVGEKFVEISMHTFIDPKVCELRIFKIMEDITSVLPVDHPYRIINNLNAIDKNIAENKVFKNENSVLNDEINVLKNENSVSINENNITKNNRYESTDIDMILDRKIIEKNYNIMNTGNIILYTDNTFTEITNNNDNHNNDDYGNNHNNHNNHDNVNNNISYDIKGNNNDDNGNSSNNDYNRFSSTGDNIDNCDNISQNDSNNDHYDKESSKSPSNSSILIDSSCPSDLYTDSLGSKYSLGSAGPLDSSKTPTESLGSLGSKYPVGSTGSLGSYPIGTLKRPAVSLERFLRETQKRRKLSVKNNLKLVSSN